MFEWYWINLPFFPHFTSSPASLHPPLLLLLFPLLVMPLVRVLGEVTKVDLQ